jgi:hypothetical protein
MTASAAAARHFADIGSLKTAIASNASQVGLNTTNLAGTNLTAIANANARIQQ